MDRAKEWIKWRARAENLEGFTFIQKIMQELASMKFKL
jgi:hypothetical protein